MPVIGNRGIRPTPQEPEVPVTHKDFLTVWSLEHRGLNPAQISEITGLHASVVQQMMRVNN